MTREDMADYFTRLRAAQAAAERAAAAALPIQWYKNHKHHKHLLQLLNLLVKAREERFKQLYSNVQMN